MKLLGAMQRLYIVLVILLTAAWSSGCSRRTAPPTAQVTGRVMYGGAPVGNITITFTPSDGRPASGTVDANGRFSLSTFAIDDGAVIGRHRVTFGSYAEVPLPGTREAKEYKPEAPRFPVRYGCLDTTDIEIDVPPSGLPDLVIDLRP